MTTRYTFRTFCGETETRYEIELLGLHPYLLGLPVTLGDASSFTTAEVEFASYNPALQVMEVQLKSLELEEWEADLGAFLGRTLMDSGWKKAEAVEV